MPEFDRFTESTEWIDLEFVERERTPRELIEKGIRYHLAGLSLLDTVTLFRIWAANEVVSPFTTGCRRLIYSQLTVKARIALR
jgi:hypothetical protein